MRQRIIQKTFELAKRYGFKRLSLDELAKELGISKKTIYKYFADKQSLVKEVITYQVELDINHTEAAFNQALTLQAKLDVIMGSLQEDQIPLWVAEELQHYFPEAYEITFRVADHRHQLGAKLKTMGDNEGLFRQDVDFEIFGKAIEATFAELMQPEYLRSRDMTCAEIMDQVKKIFFYGVLSKRIVRDE